MRHLMLATFLVATVGGCAWVKMAPGGAEVRVARADQSLVSCEKRGEISVSVKDRLGPIERSDIKVRDELETLARNEAPGLQADTVQPRGEPVDGEQRFVAFRCGPATGARTTPPATATADGEAQTYPIQD